MALVLKQESSLEEGEGEAFVLPLVKSVGASVLFFRSVKCWLLLY